VLSGLAPAFQASRPDLVPALKADTAQGGGRLRMRNAFLVGQIAMSLLLVLTAGLFLRALGRAATVPSGFDQTHVDVINLDLTLGRYTEETGPGFARDLVARMSTQPGVQSAAMVADLPLDGGRMGLGSVRTPGLRRGDSEDISPDWNTVSPGYFRTMTLPLVRGRDFNDADTAAAPRVAIVNEAMARAIWNTIDVVGRTIEINDRTDWEPATIVGVASDARLISLQEAVEPYLYVAYAQRYTPRISLVVKTTGASAIAQARAVMRQINPNLPIAQALPLSGITALTLIPQRIAGAVAGTLGIVGLLLAAIGIYGVTSYNVSRRVREIGVRVALGADAAAVRWMVLRQGLTLTVIGVGIGLAAGAAGAQVLRSLLFGVSTLDPLTFGGAALLFGLIAAAASYGPARRATKVDPMMALRAE
jgi:predicted permease